jgi:predicted AlkP superfamily pyrophosphatase or phosphodiesterase
MINQNSVEAVNASRLNAHFVKPLYDSYCFANIPALIRYALTGEGQPDFPDDVLGHLPRRYKKVILLFIDAFGWRFFSPWQDRSPFLKRFAERGVVSKITSQFPSTTTAHITALHTGLPVGQSGAFEWFYYEPLVDRIIAPMLFSFAGDRERETLLQTGIAPESFYPPQSFYHDLAAQGVKSTLIQYHEYAHSAYLKSTLSGTTSLAYKSLSEALSLLSDAVNSADGPAYFFLGIDMIDSLCHQYGPHSARLEAEIETTLYALEQHLYQHIADSDDTLLLVTADHGQTAVSPGALIALSETTPALEAMIQRNRQGDLLVPAGSSRDMFLYIEPRYLTEAHSLLTESLAGRAEVYRTDDLIAQGFFGSVSDRFRERVGNLVALPYSGYMVWWKRSHPQFYGHHGGLTADEMETILLAVDV